MKNLKKSKEKTITINPRMEEVISDMLRIGNISIAYLQRRLGVTHEFAEKLCNMIRENKISIKVNEKPQVINLQSGFIQNSHGDWYKADALIKLSIKKNENFENQFVVMADFSNDMHDILACYNNLLDASDAIKELISKMNGNNFSRFF